MVKVIMVMAVSILVSSCMCDYYVTEAGGLRSKRLYKRYVKINSELPLGIDTNCLYQTKYSIYNYMDGTIDTVYPKGSHLYTRYFANGRRASFQLSTSDLDSTNGSLFGIEKCRIGYYELKNGEFYVYGYSPGNCGSFGKGVLNRVEGNMLIFGKGDGRTYVEKIDAPAAWLPPGKPDW